jgi:hypothetical protein
MGGLLGGGSCESRLSDGRVSLLFEVGGLVAPSSMVTSREASTKVAVNVAQEGVKCFLVKCLYVSQQTL